MSVYISSLKLCVLIPRTQYYLFFCAVRKSKEISYFILKWSKIVFNTRSNLSHHLSTIELLNSAFYILVFVELKWYRTWKYYLVFVFLYLLFLMALAGFTLLHLGNIYDGAPKYDQFQVNFIIYNNTILQIMLLYYKFLHYI